MADKTVAIVSDGHGAENLVSLVLALAMIRDLRAALEPFVKIDRSPGRQLDQRFGIVQLGPLDDYDFTGAALIDARAVYARTGAAAK